jgi:hypothetical protein
MGVAMFDWLLTALSGIGNAAKGADLAMKGWGSLAKWIWGHVEITEPGQRTIGTSEWITVKGTHKGKKRGHYWLMTCKGSDFWPKEEVDFQLDGTWSARLNVGQRPGPKEVLIALVWVDDTVDALLQDIRRRISFAKDLIKNNNLDKTLLPQCSSPFELKRWSNMSFSVVSHRTVPFPQGPVS